jgi:hypothetical protein
MGTRFLMSHDLKDDHLVDFLAGMSFEDGVAEYYGTRRPIIIAAHSTCPQERGAFQLRLVN